MPRKTTKANLPAKVSKKTPRKKALESKEEIDVLVSEIKQDIRGQFGLKESFLGKRKLPSYLFFVAIIALGLLGFLLKDKYLAAIVNGKPIFRFELNQRLVNTYGKEVLENLVVEQLVKQEATKKKIEVTEKDIDEEIAKLSQSLGEGTNIEEVLKFQGISMKDFREQLKMRLQVNRILADEVSVTDEETDSYVKQNSQTLTATSEAERKNEAREIIQEQKMGQRIQSWIGELLDQAKIQRFLK